MEMARKGMATIIWKGETVIMHHEMQARKEGKC
jgi:hypothetical protein